MKIIKKNRGVIKNVVDKQLEKYIRKQKKESYFRSQWTALFIMIIMATSAIAYFQKDGMLSIKAVEPEFEFLR